MIENKPSKASLACEVRMNIRCGEIMTYQTLVKLLKKELPYIPEIHDRYLLGFFEECYPSLMKKFMTEHNISREEIISMFNQLPDSGEKYKFSMALKNNLF